MPVNVAIGPGRSAVVTGGSSGIGAATATLLAARGCDVTVTGRDPEALAEVASRTGGRACVADLTEPEAAGRVLSAAGEVDLLVCNAGVGWAGSLTDMTEADVEKIVRVNLVSVLTLVRLALPGMVARGRGHVVLVSSIAGHMGVAGETVYSATKAGLAGFGAAVRNEFAARGIAVSLVVPGVVSTSFFERRGTPYERTSPRPIPPERVARALVKAVDRNRAEVFVPAWLRLPARLRGAAPALIDTVQRHVT